MNKKVVPLVASLLLSFSTVGISQKKDKEIDESNKTKLISLKKDIIDSSILSTINKK